MRRPRLWVAGAVAWLVVVNARPASAQGMDPERAFSKLTRGAINVITGWVEIPKRVSETSQVSGTVAGVTWGLLRGLGHGFIRTIAGVYEVVTFPFPAPPDYDPVIMPEYIFTVTDLEREHHN